MKNSFFSKPLQEHKASSYIWKPVKNICNPPEDSSLPEELSVGNKTFNIHADVINELNAFFANISENVQQASQGTNVDCVYDSSKPVLWLMKL